MPVWALEVPSSGRDAKVCLGVRILDPVSSWIDVDVALGRDATLEPGTILLHLDKDCELPSDITGQPTERLQA